MSGSCVLASHLPWALPPPPPLPLVSLDKAGAHAPSPGHRGRPGTGPCWGAVPGEQEMNHPARCAAARRRHRGFGGTRSQWWCCCRSIPGSGWPHGQDPLLSGGGSVPQCQGPAWPCLAQQDPAARCQHWCWGGCQCRGGHASPSAT